MPALQGIVIWQHPCSILSQYRADAGAQQQALQRLPQVIAAE